MQYRNCLEDSFTVTTATCAFSLPVESFISQLLVCVLAISRKLGLVTYAHVW